MTKQKTSPIFWAAAFTLLLLSQAIPALAQSRGETPTNPDTLFNCTWSAGPVAPAALLDAPTVTVGGNLYLFGGVQGGAITAASFKFDGTTWTPIAPLPAAVEFAAAVTDGTDIYILGGALAGSGTPQTTLTRYNVASNTYTALAPFTTGTWNHPAVFLGGKIYKWSGTGPATASTSVTEIYDVATNTWGAGPAYPLAISFVSGWTQGGFIYSAGGIQSVGSVASAKTFRLDPADLGAGWVDAPIADLPATRWGAATAVYTDAVLAGGFVAGTASANISDTAISWDVPSNTWQTLPNMLARRTRMGAAVLNNNLYVVGGSGDPFSFTGTNDNQKLLCLNVPTNIIGSAGSSVSSAGVNGALDPGESVTVTFGARNVGGPGVVCTTALTGTLQATGGVTSPSGPQVYGSICSGGAPAVHRGFTFTVDPALPCGSTVTASVVMTDGETNYGTLTYSFITGNLATAYAENFDAVVAPALPAGWTTTFSGLGAAVTTSTTFPDTAPNDIFLTEASNVALSEVASTTIALPAGGASRLTFRNLFNTEPGFDGLVLEIKIGAGAFQDILAAGGTFVSGGYNTTLATGFANPLPGRMAWAGLSGGTAAAPAYITSVVTLPAAAAGQNVQLQWRQGSDNSVLPATNPGSRIDTIAIVNPLCNTTAPVPSSALSRKTHTGVGIFDIALPLVPLTGAIGIEPRTDATVPGQHQVVVTFPSAVAVGGVAISAGTGAASFSVANNVVTINLTGVTDRQRLALSLSNVSSGANLGNVQIPMGLLNGDVNGVGGVTATDVSQTKAASGLTTAGTFRSDVNATGSITTSDIGIVKASSGNNLP